jgi:hypothetical protein
MLRSVGCRVMFLSSWCNTDGEVVLGEEEGWKIKESGLGYVLELIRGFSKSWTRVPLNQEDDAINQPMMSKGPAL